MKLKLRKVGNSLGITIPASQLKALGASSGDLLELELIRVIPATRSGWDKPEAWTGSDIEPLYLDVDNEFDELEWEW